MNEKRAQNVFLMIFCCCCYFPFIWRTQIGAMRIMLYESFSWFYVWIFCSMSRSSKRNQDESMWQSLTCANSLHEIKDFDKIIFGFLRFCVYIILLSFPLSLGCECELQWFHMTKFQRQNMNRRTKMPKKRTNTKIQCRLWTNKLHYYKFQSASWVGG